jgi:hypothetical protein
VTDFFSVLHGQRACRRFDANQEVPDDDIESILGGADYVRGHASQRVFEDVNQGIAGGGFAAAPVIVVVGADTRLVAESFAPSVDLPVGTELALGRKRQGLRILHPRSRLSGSTTETTRSTASAPRP